MAVTKIWPVRGRADKPLEYVANELKTANPKWDKSSLGNLTDVMHYAADENKTEKQFFVSGINCSPEIARDQFVTVKKQFAKEDGIVAYHGYQSFAEGEVSSAILLFLVITPVLLLIVANSLDDNVHSAVLYVFA